MSAPQADIAPRLFVSVFAYAFGKFHGANVNAALARELENPHEPWAQTLAEARKQFDIQLHFDASTLIAKARCRAAGEFLRSGLPVWLMLDDDVHAKAGALLDLHDVANANAGNDIAIAAMTLRDGSGLNVDMWSGGKPEHGDVWPVRRGGLALAMVPRAAVVEMQQRHPELDWSELRGGVAVSHPGLFLETIEVGKWQGEDVKFCDRANAAGVRMFALYRNDIAHAGVKNP